MVLLILDEVSHAAPTLPTETRADDRAVGGPMTGSPAALCQGGLRSLTTEPVAGRGRVPGSCTHRARRGCASWLRRWADPGLVVGKLTIRQEL